VVGYVMLYLADTNSIYRKLYIGASRGRCAARSTCWLDGEWARDRIGCLEEQLRVK
jgi:hypothetical protein